MEENIKVYVSVYRTKDGIEVKVSPEKGLSLEEAIKFLESQRAK